MTQSRRDFLRAAAALAIIPEIDRPSLTWKPRDPASVAVIGTGRQGRAIVTELQKMPNVKVAALCDTNAGRLESGIRRAKDAVGFATHKELLDKATGVTAVFVATPTHRHKEICVDALAAGKHVFCEAPLASSMEDLTAIMAAARGAKTVFHTGMQGRSNPIYGLARSFARAGAIRDIASVRAQAHKKTTWRSPSANADDAEANWRLDEKVSLGLLGEWGIHQFDVVHWFINAYPTSVRANGSIRLHKDGRTVPDTVSCEFAFADGLRMQYAATLGNSFDGTYELFHGEMGAIKLAWNAGWLFKEADAPTQGWEVYANREPFHSEQGITLIADATKLAAQNKLKEGVGLPETPLYFAITDFLKSALEQKPVVCSAQDGFRANVVALHAQRALASGKEEAIDPALFKESGK